MVNALFMIGPAEKQMLSRLRQFAELNPITEELADEVNSGRISPEEWSQQMMLYSMELPFGYRVTFTVEVHPNGKRTRRMSMSSPNMRRIPLPEAFNMVLPSLGFKKTFEQCYTFPEDVPDGRIAINVIEDIT